LPGIEFIVEKFEISSLFQRYLLLAFDKMKIQTRSNLKGKREKKLLVLWNKIKKKLGKNFLSDDGEKILNIFFYRGNLCVF
jgi:hypothetical protein